MIQQEIFFIAWVTPTLIVVVADVINNEIFFPTRNLQEKGECISNHSECISASIIYENNENTNSSTVVINRMEKKPKKRRRMTKKILCFYYSFLDTETQCPAGYLTVSQ